MFFFEIYKGCEEGWTYYDESCYLFPKEKKSYEEANSQCESTVASSHIAVINSATENTFILRQFISKRISGLDVTMWMKTIFGLVKMTRGCFTLKMRRMVVGIGRGTGVSTRLFSFLRYLRYLGWDRISSDICTFLPPSNKCLSYRVPIL